MASTKWDSVIKPQDSLFNLDLKNVWKYRDLLLLLVRRDIVAVYKQTILGPLWFFIQPILTSVVYKFVFTDLANISTGGLPPMLFYLSGVTLWNYFSTCLTATSNVFKSNAAIFGKVYFPRVIMPMAIVTANLVKLGIQLLLLSGFWIYYYFNGADLSANWAMLLVLFLIFFMAVYGLGFGMIISAATTKYRDLAFLLAFGVQLFMYASAVIYPINTLTGKIKTAVQFNPIANIVETFRYAVTGSGELNLWFMLYTVGLSFVIFFIGLVIFNRIQRSFVDTV